MRIVVVLLFGVVATLGSLAQNQAPPACKYRFAFVYVDRLDNTNQGIPEKQLKSVESRLRKYPAVCYTPNETTADFIFFVHTKPAVYHGTRIVTDTTTSSNPVNGTITDQDGSTSTVDGTVNTTTTNSTAVPYELDYSVFILNILRPKHGSDPSKPEYEIVHTFDQKGLYRTIYGIGYGKGKHPIPALIEEAADWLQGNSGGKATGF